MYRPATISEVVRAKNVLVKQEIIEFWRSQRDEWVPNAVRVELQYGSEYNDEGGYYDTMEDVTWYDADGKVIEEDKDGNEIESYFFTDEYDLEIDTDLTEIFLDDVINPTITLYVEVPDSE